MEQVCLLSQYCERRARKEPIQYIVGDWDFCSLTLKCRSPILIPRPETEELVELVLKSMVLQSLPAPIVLDIGCGTGAIGLALLSKLSSRSRCVAIDVNPAAVALALENYNLCFPEEKPPRYSCVHSSFADYCASGSGDCQFDYIVSNPPYIPAANLANLQPEVRLYEDSLALNGGLDGLDIVREILCRARRLLRPGGPRELWLEVSTLHPPMIRAWLESLAPSEQNFEFLSALPDISGRDRFVRLRGIF